MEEDRDQDQYQENPFDNEPNTHKIGDGSNAVDHLDHTTRVHLQHAKLQGLIKDKKHWIFAMQGDCALIAIQLARLHIERCDSSIPMVWLCCLDGTPAFFAFPKESLRYDEIASEIGLEMSSTQAELEARPFLTISMEDPQPLRDKLEGWIKKDHLVN